MGLLEMIREFNELLDEKDGLKEATKRNNEAISAKTKEIAEQMIDDDVPSISVGGYKFFLQNKTMYSKKIRRGADGSRSGLPGCLKRTGAR